MCNFFIYKYLNFNSTNALTKIIVENDFDEQRYLHNRRLSFINSPVYKTSLIPTFDCNYRCWYCTQKHIPVKIEKDKIQLILKHVKKYLIENEIEEYILSWFGGEPLTQPSIIERISRDLLAFCQEYGIVFSGAITSNGALLSLPVIEMLRDVQVNTYQIAIDGTSKNHDKIKFDSSNVSSFKLVINNIKNLIEINDKADVTLRFNYTPATIKELELVDEINEIIPKDLRCKIQVDLHHVWQIKEDIVKIEELRAMQKRFVDAGYKLSTAHVFSMCYVEKAHYNTIYYTGQVEKCDIRSMDNLRGYIDEKGDIVWKEKPIFGQYDLMDKNCICSECNHYPLCYNGCPIVREDRIKKYGKAICGHYGDYSILEYRVKDFCWRTIYNKSAGF